MLSNVEGECSLLSCCCAEDASEPEAKEEGAEGEDEAEREHEDELRRLSHSSAGYSLAFRVQFTFSEL